MSATIRFYASKIYGFFVRKCEEETENDDVLTSSSVKRRPEENTDEEMLPKKKRILPSTSARTLKNDTNLCVSSYLNNSLSEFQKENQQMASDNIKTDEILRRRQKSPRIKQQEIYCIDDEDSNIQNTRSNIPSQREMKDRSQINNLTESASSEDCVVVNETFPTPCSNSSSYPKLCLSRVQREREQVTLIELFAKQCPRRSIPLTNSTIHNTKLNKSAPSHSFKTRSYTRNHSLKHCHPVYSPSIRSLNHSVQPAELAFDKTVIDLTNSEDDEDQREVIESRILSSSQIKHMKSTFIAEDTFALDEDLISNLTKKYDTKLQRMSTRVSKIEKGLSEQSDEFAKTISEILQKRLTLKEHVEETEDVSQKSSMEIAPVTKEMIGEINSILSSKKSPLVQIKDTSVKLQDIRTLENTAWLNDEVINAYMNLIKLRSEENPDKYPKVYCFNTFLYEQLSKKGYTSVRRWTRKVDIFDFEILIIPIHLGNHWCLTQIRFPENTIYYYDSMGSPNNRCLNTMKEYLIDEYKDKKTGQFDTSNWKLINVPFDNLPQQKNAYDCGVFACTFAEHVTRNAPLDFDQDNMPYFRVKMMYEILTGKLLL